MLWIREGGRSKSECEIQWLMPTNKTIKTKAKRKRKMKKKNTDIRRARERMKSWWFYVCEMMRNRENQRDRDTKEKNRPIDLMNMQAVNYKTFQLLNAFQNMCISFSSDKLYSFASNTHNSLFPSRSYPLISKCHNLSVNFHGYWWLNWEIIVYFASNFKQSAPTFCLISSLAIEMMEKWKTKSERNPHKKRWRMENGEKFVPENCSLVGRVSARKCVYERVCWTVQCIVIKTFRCN